MTLVDEIRARRGDPDDPFDQDAARRDYKRESTRKDRELKEAARHGEQAGRDEERRRQSEHKSRGRPAGPRRSRRPRSTTTRRAVRQMSQPLRAQVSSGMRTLGLTLGVVALYLVLTAEEDTHAFSGALGGLSKALRWLSDPTTSIPYPK